MTKEDKSKRRNALGKGLSALLDDAGKDDLVVSKDISAAGPVALVPVAQIEANPWQPRTNFDLVALEELAESIKVQGIIQPVTVRRVEPGRYQLISGERRLQASKLAGLTEVPAYVRTADDEQMLEMALIENIQREDLNPMEIAFAYKRMVDELGLKLEELGDKVGKKRATVNNYLRLLKLPAEVQLGLKENKISMGHARAIISIPEKKDQIGIYNRILAEDLSVRKVEELVREMAEPKKKEKKQSDSSGKNIHLRKLEDQLEDQFGNRVLIKQQQTGKGDIRISFESTEDLNRILEILGIL